MTEHTLSLASLEESLANGDHSIFSASGSHMWAWCAGSLIPNLLAEDNSGFEAAEGTVAHEIGEIWQRSRKKPRHLIGTTQVVQRKGVKFIIEIDETMMDHVQRYVDWCEALDGDHFIEQKVYYSQYTPIKKQGGTMDHAAAEWQRLTVTDLKYGKGVQIFAKDNPQIKLYALGIFLELDWLYNFQEIVLRIAQPRFNHFDVAVITRQELLDFAVWIKERAFAAWTFDAPRTPGEKQCQFCKVKATCSAHIAFQDRLMSGLYGDLTLPVDEATMIEVKDAVDWMQPFKTHRPIAELDTTQMAILYRYKGFVESWWKQLGIELTKRAKNGEKVPMLKLVEGRTHRTYVNHKRAVDYLVDTLDIDRQEVVIETLVSPAELEVVLRKNGFARSEIPSLLAPVVVKPKGKPSLVSDADRRPELGEEDAGLYEDLTITKPEDDETEDI